VSQGGCDRMDMIKEINGTFFTRPGDYMDAQAPPTFLPSFKQSVATSTAYTLIKRGEVPHCTVRYSTVRYSTVPHCNFRKNLLELLEISNFFDVPALYHEQARP
jgi:hypothetical protein